MSESGKVYIVGGGPGDLELITVKGLKLVREADVILYDRLAPREVLK
ncbi:MAG: SAM-dependent methyltransferase, partial [Acidilobaceae archaeon]